MKSFENINILIKVKLLFENVFLEKSFYLKKEFLKQKFKKLKKNLFLNKFFWEKKNFFAKKLKKNCFDRWCLNVSAHKSPKRPRRKVTVGKKNVVNDDVIGAHN